jgi:hypothetical protein
MTIRFNGDRSGSKGFSGFNNRFRIQLIRINPIGGEAPSQTLFQSELQGRFARAIQLYCRLISLQSRDHPLKPLQDKASRAITQSLGLGSIIGVLARKICGELPSADLRYSVGFRLHRQLHSRRLVPPTPSLLAYR